jgi:hypothetical protein
MLARLAYIVSQGSVKEDTVQMTHTHMNRRAGSRLAFGALAGLLATAALVELVSHGTGWWQFFAFGIGPDVALLFGAGASLEKGQLHPRAVPLYNALHTFFGPALLALAAIVLPAGYLIGALAWAAHVALDRAVGYGQRTRDGFQRS